MIALSRSQVAQTCPPRVAAPTPPAVTATDVLKRLREAFRVDARERHELDVIDDREAELTTKLEDGRVVAKPGYSVLPLPEYNRQSWGPLADPLRDKALDATATALIRKDLDKAPRAIELDELVDRCRKKVLTRVRAEPSYWARLCAIHKSLPPPEPFDCNAELRAIDAARWIAPHEDDRDLEEARQLTLFWLQSEMTQRAFCQRFGVHRTTLRREIEKYCASVARRLNEAPRLVWVPSVTTESRVSKNETVVRGVDAIAHLTRRKPASALRLINGGKAPIAMLGGEPCALRELLDIEKYRSKAKTALLAA